ncbi:MAG: thioredoxin [Holophagales bacterium]|nr:thioredoxin [Holophagales bacterium]
MAGNLQEFTAANFDQVVLKSSKPVLVDFWAVWCGPCRQVAPVVEALAGKWGETVVVGKVNVDDHPSIAEKYNIMSIPTLMLFKDGAVVERVIGFASQSALEQKFQQYIACRARLCLQAGRGVALRVYGVRGAGVADEGPGRIFRATGPSGPST